MWLVVYKQAYYPSVFECDSEEAATTLYNKIKKEKFNDQECGMLVGRLYITKVEQSYGDYKLDVDWYLDVG